MSINNLFNPQVDGIDVIQYGSSVLSVGNKQAVYKNPFGTNITEDLGGGQQVLTMQIRALEDSDRNNLEKALRGVRVISVIDKYKGEFNCTVKSFEQTDDESHIGESRYRVTFNVNEAVGTPRQNIVSQIEDQRDQILESINYDNLKVENKNMLDDLKETLQSGLDTINDNVNIGSANIKTASSYVHSFQSISSNIDTLIFTPDVLATQVKNLTQRIRDLYPDSPQKQFQAVQTLPNNQINQTTTLSNLQNDIIFNENLVNEQFDKVVLYLLLDLITTLDFRDNEQAQEIQDELQQRLITIDFQDNSVSEITNSTSQYIESLDLPEVISDNIRATNAITLAYDLYEDIDRLNIFRDLNGTRNEDDLQGDLKVLSK